MKLSLLLLLLLSCVWANLEYKGFIECERDGWSCNTIPGADGYEIVYDCSRSRTQHGRLWVWTARLPNKSKKLTIRNCSHLELHADCTRSKRNTAILELRIVNVGTLVFLEPSTGELHDNIPIIHFPPLLYLENVQNTSFYSGLFLNENESCYYNAMNLKKIVLKRVGIKSIPSKSLFIDMEELHWSQVRVDDIETNGITVSGSITIEDSYFGSLLTNAMTFSGPRVTLRRNTIGQILPKALSVLSSDFQLVNNSIREIMPLGLSVRSSHVSIDRNTIQHLGNAALEGVGPAYYRLDSAYSLTYNFTRNTIQSLSPFSLHNNWTQYENACSKITIDNNQFDCSCSNVIWFYGYINDNNKLSNSGFYKLFLNTTHHCGTSRNCSLASIVPYACHNKTTIEANCLGFREKENFSFLLNTTELDIAVTTETPRGNFKNRDGDKSKSGDDDDDALDNADQQEMVLDDTYYRDNGKDSVASKSSFPIWIVVVIFFFLATLNVLAYVTFYLRKRRILSADVCKYEKNGDSDTLIIKGRNEGSNIECENVSFQD